jgi:hypothetical protein
MGIVSISELSADREAAWSIRGGRTYTVDLDVTTDDDAIGPRAVILGVCSTLSLYPASPYRFPLTTTATETDPASFLQSARCRTNEEGLQHTVTLEFGPFDASIEGAAVGASVNVWVMSPFEQRPAVKWGSRSEDFAVTHDRDGEPILNTVGDPFDPPIQVPVSTPVAVVTRVLKSFDPDWIAVFKDAVNDDTWLGFPAESVLCQDITAEPFYDADWGWLWTVTMEFAFRPSRVDMTAHGIVIDPGWAVQVLNAGLRAKLPGGGVGQVLIDNAPISSPVALKADGTYDSTADPYYLSFNVRRTADFDLLDLPSDLFTVSTP